MISAILDYYEDLCWKHCDVAQNENILSKWLFFNVLEDAHVENYLMPSMICRLIMFHSDDPQEALIATWHQLLWSKSDMHKKILTIWNKDILL